MGIIDFTRGGFVGKVGTHYGQKSWSQMVLKKTPLKNAPQSQNQQRSVRAFEILNRFAGGFSKIGFSYVAKKNPKLLKHNQIAQIFKGLIQNHFFSWNNFSEIGEIDNSCILENFERNYDLNILELQARTTASINKKEKKVWYVFVFDNIGKIVFSACPDSQTFSAQIPINQNYQSFYRCIVFRSEWKIGKAKFYGFDTNMKELIFNGVWHIPNSENSNAYIIEENRIICADSESEVVGKIMKVR